MRIGLRKKEHKIDLAIKHIQLIIDEKEYYISFHYSLRSGIKDVRIYGEPAVVIDAYPAFPKVVKICAYSIWLDIRLILHRIIRKMKVHNQLGELHCLARIIQDEVMDECVKCLNCKYAFECSKEFKESGNILFLELMKELERCTSVDIFLHRNKSLSILKGSWAEKYPDALSMLTNKSFEEQLDSLMSPDILQYSDNQCCK